LATGEFRRDLAQFWTRFSYTSGPRILIADRLDNIPRLVEHLDFSATQPGTLAAFCLSPVPNRKATAPQ
jgi:hypothetical protein